MTKSAKTTTKPVGATLPSEARIAQRSGTLADGTRIKVGKALPKGLDAKQLAGLVRLGVIPTIATTTKPEG